MEKPSILSKKPGKGIKAAANKTAARPAEKRKYPPKRILALGVSAGAVIIIVLFIFYTAPRTDVPSAAPPRQTKALSPMSVSEGSGAPPPGLSGNGRKGVPAVRTIRFEPPQPTRRDTLKAEVLTDAPGPGGVSYEYVWKINEQIVEKARGDTLDLSALGVKKWDVITVAVTPYIGGREGFTAESPVVAVHSIPPTLDLKMPNQASKASEPLEMQLVSLHPDSDRVTFSLAPPLITGMSIDPGSGKITWIIQPDQKGTMRFGAAVEDTEKNRVAKIFNITLQ
jgi:hypothetical protein